MDSIGKNQKELQKLINLIEMGGGGLYIAAVIVNRIYLKSD